MPTQDVILGIIASTVMLCCMLSIVSMPLAVCKHASNNVKVVAKVEAEIVKVVAKVEAEIVKVAGAEVIKEASAVVAASVAEEDSKRGKR